MLNLKYRRRKLCPGHQLIAGVFILVMASGCKDTDKSIGVSRSAPPQPVPELSRLLTMTEQELSQFDLALINLACAEGLSSDVSSTQPSQTLKLMTQQTRLETDRHFARYVRDPAEFQDSEPYFRLLCLITVLQQDFGVRYHPERARPQRTTTTIEPNDTFYADSSPVFLTGLIGQTPLGTCASLPVLYVVIGRRLGYPMKLVTTGNHLFARWDDGSTRLNVEATSPGLVVFDDDYYRRWPFPVSPDVERRERYLVSLSPREEFGVFLSLRAHCLAAARRWHEAVDVQREVCHRFPSSHVHAGFLSELMARDQRENPRLVTRSDR